MTVPWDSHAHMTLDDFPSFFSSPLFSQTQAFLNISSLFLLLITNINSLTHITPSSTMSSAIDETPLSAFPHDRRNSLEKHLQTRPDMQDLKNRHILLNTNVAPYTTLSF